MKINPSNKVKEFVSDLKSSNEGKAGKLNGHDVKPQKPSKIDYKLIKLNQKKDGLVKEMSGYDSGRLKEAIASKKEKILVGKSIQSAKNDVDYRVKIKKYKNELEDLKKEYREYKKIEKKTEKVCNKIIKLENKLHNN